MKNILFLTIFLIFSQLSNAQKDSLQLGDRYSEDHLYASISYAQLMNQPTGITRSGFSYGISLGFIKDFTLNKQGNIAVAVGVGYGYDFFNHELKVEDVNGNTTFDSGIDLESNKFSAHNLEIPIEFRWRTSTAKKYDFWRIYPGIKFLYNFSNNFNFIDNNTSFSFDDVASYRKLQYGLTLSAGYDEFNFHVYYSLTPLFENATLNGEEINSSIIKFGLIFYIL
ncbi:porin family protein [Polaribacter sp. MED152]|uniref:porin family protein n=1 Tax=Polaribacter sp. MED152 TaxID=313598 RepID=UPI000068CA19|nr:porin family protein [Polaribacter sp. MED152]EAQ43233.1 hypothetical protein MED152_10925 [Polaribacter sp. MED152]